MLQRKRPNPGFSQGQFGQNYGPQQKRTQTQQGVYAPTMIPMESLDNESIFNDAFLDNDQASMLIISPHEGSISNQFPAFPTPRLSQLSNTSQTERAQVNVFTQGVVRELRDQLGEFDTCKASPSSIREQDLQEPWNAFNMGGDKVSRPAIDPLQTQYYQRGLKPPSFTNVPVYQAGRTDNVTTRPRSDSGYGTHGIKSPGNQSTTHSIFSGESLAGTMRDCSSLTGEMGEMNMNFPPYDHNFDHVADYGQMEFLNENKSSDLNVFRAQESGPWICNTCSPDSAPLKNKSEWRKHMLRHVEYGQMEPLIETKPFDFNVFNMPENGPWICNTCPPDSAPPKNKSEWKKHMLRHSKPFKCTYPTCKRSGHGFSTKNDLDRHRKSVHQIFPDRSATDRTFVCAAPGCTKSNKVWPRADNFKQHCERLHKKQGVDVDWLMARSWQRDWIASGREQPRLPSAAISLGGEPQAMVHSSAESSTFCQAVQDPHQNIEYSQTQLAISPDCLPAFVSNTSASADNLNTYTVMPYSRSVTGTGALYFNDNAKDEANSFETATQVSARDATSNGKDVKHKEKTFMHPGNLQPVDPGTRSLKTSKAAGQKKPIVHNGREGTDTSETALATSTRPQVGPTNRTKAEQVSEDVLELIRSMKTEIDPSKEGELTQNFEAMIKDQVLKMVKTKSYTDTAKANEDKKAAGPIKKTRCKCLHPKCGKYKDSASALKKHMKRHTRPYGCTYTDCHKKFGSKNDWKRHENTRHYQAECWRCTEPAKDSPLQIEDPTHTQQPSSSNLNMSASNASRDETAAVRRQRQKYTQGCRGYFWQKDHFKEHLRNHHHITDKLQIKKRKTANHIGRNGQGTFWCGFCDRIIRLKSEGTDAWDEKFDHIDNEHFKQGIRIEFWRELDGKMKGGEDAEARSLEEGWVEMDGKQSKDMKAVEEEELDFSDSDSEGGEDCETYIGEEAGDEEPIINIITIDNDLDQQTCCYNPPSNSQLHSTYTLESRMTDLMGDSNHPSIHLTDTNNVEISTTFPNAIQAHHRSPSSPLSSTSTSSASSAASSPDITEVRAVSSSQFGLTFNYLQQPQQLQQSQNFHLELTAPIYELDRWSISDPATIDASIAAERPFSAVQHPTRTTNRPTDQHGNSGIVERSTSSDNRSRRKHEAGSRSYLLWVCCQCGDGPKDQEVHNSCAGLRTTGQMCGHKRCGSCEELRLAQVKDRRE